MFRTAILRSTAAVRTAAMRPVSANAARRITIAAAAPRVAIAAAPKAAAWQTVRCYASAGGLDRKDVYDRIKQLLSGFDKVRFGHPSLSGRAPPTLGRLCAGFANTLANTCCLQVNDPANVSSRPPEPADTEP